MEFKKRAEYELWKQFLWFILSTIIKFLFYLKDENGKKIKVDAVCGTSTTNNVFKLDISDGIEYCIRNIKAIDNDSVKLYNENEDIERRR